MRMHVFVREHVNASPFCAPYWQNRGPAPKSKARGRSSLLLTATLTYQPTPTLPIPRPLHPLTNFAHLISHQTHTHTRMHSHTRTYTPTRMHAQPSPPSTPPPLHRVSLIHAALSPLPSRTPAPLHTHTRTHSLTHTPLTSHGLPYRSAKVLAAALAASATGMANLRAG